MKYIFFLIILLLPFAIADENITFNETNLTSSDINNFSNFTEEEVEVNETILNETIDNLFFNVLDFAILSFSEGDFFSFDWFEIILSSSSFSGGEYSGNFYVDVIETPNVVSSGTEYSLDSGSFGLLSDPPKTVVSPYCGDGVCNNGETCSSCPGDCGICVIVSSGGGSSRTTEEEIVDITNETEEIVEVIPEVIPEEIPEEENDSIPKPKEEVEVKRGITGQIILGVTENMEEVALGLILLFMLFGIWRIKKIHFKKKKKKRRLAKILKKSYNQTGSTNLSRDRKVRALAPGKRLSKNGKIYYETRMNHSDQNGKMSSIEKKKK